MQKDRLTKTLSLEKSIVETIQKIAATEHRSFTQQMELMLTNALKRQKSRKQEGAA